MNPTDSNEQQSPDRIYIHPASAEYHLNKWPLEESEYVGYIREDLARSRAGAVPADVGKLVESIMEVFGTPVITESAWARLMAVCAAASSSCYVPSEPTEKCEKCGAVDAKRTPRGLMCAWCAAVPTATTAETCQFNKGHSGPCTWLRPVDSSVDTSRWCGKPVINPDWCDVCDAPQFVTPDGEHHCAATTSSPAAQPETTVGEEVEVGPPRIGMMVRLRSRVLGLSTHWKQTVTAVKPLTLADGFEDAADILADGNYWVQTSHTDRQWVAWVHFKSAEQPSLKDDTINSDPTQFTMRSFAVLENRGHSLRLINRTAPRRAISIPWNELSALRAIIDFATEGVICPDCVEGKINVGCAIDRPLISVECGRCKGTGRLPATASEGERDAHRCPHCGRRMQADFDEDVGAWFECANCDYREAVSNVASEGEQENS